jgi:hypothetical protein
MAKKQPTTLSIPKFFGKYSTPIEQAHAAEERQRNMNAAKLMEIIERGEYEAPRMIKSEMLWEEVERWWPIRLLREAVDEGDSEGCKRLLHYFLSRLGVRLPEGVLIPFRWKRGRPKETEGIYEAWIAKGRPTTTWRVCDDLAKTFYAHEFAQAKSNSNLRKKLRDRVRATIARHGLAPAAIKSLPI